MKTFSRRPKSVALPFATSKDYRNISLLEHLFKGVSGLLATEVNNGLVESLMATQVGGVRKREAVQNIFLIDEIPKRFRRAARRDP